MSEPVDNNDYLFEKACLSSDFLFIPAYRDGNPAVSWAQWTGANAWTITDWHNYGDLCRDMGGVVMNLNTTGKKVSYVGWLGFAWNWDRDQHWHGIGYPAAHPHIPTTTALVSMSKTHIPLGQAVTRPEGVAVDRGLRISPVKQGHTIT